MQQSSSSTSSSNIKDIIDHVKANTYVPTLLSTLAGIRTPASGQAISAPHFIRPDDNTPSFGVYDNGCYDFATSTYYDAISIVMLALNMTFPQAVEYLHGAPVFSSHHREDFSRQLSESQKHLNDQISFWHSELLKNSKMLDYLHSRRISDEFIKSYKLGWAEQKGRIIIPFKYNGRFCYYTGREMLGRDKLPSKLPDGSRNPEYQPKYKKAYLSGPESDCYVNVPWGIQTLDPHKKHYDEYIGVDGNTYKAESKNPRDGVLVITEGGFDGFSFAQDGWQVLATCGGDMPKNYMPIFLNLAKSYKSVFICFDSDSAGSMFQRKMCRILFNNHIMFNCGHLPAELNGHTIKDVSDYYVAGGDLAELVKHATPGLVEMAKNTQTLDELAELFSSAALWVPDYKLGELRDACYLIEDEEQLAITGFRYAKYSKKIINQLYASATKAIPEFAVAEWINKKHTLTFDEAGTFYEYKNGVWGQISDFIIHKYVGEVLGLKASSGRMRNVTNYLKDTLAERTEFNRKPVIVFMNGTLHLDLPDPELAFKPHHVSDMCTQYIPYNYIPKAKAEKWLKFIREICGNDPAKMKLMQQMAGYVLCPDNRFQKFFYLLGDGSNGKSVFLNILEAVYGAANCSSVQPSRLGNQFDPIALKDSMLNLCYEAKVALNGAEEALKAVASGDSIMAAHKGVDAVKFSTRAKFFIAANKCFASDDVSFGFLRRIIFLKFDRQFTGDKANKNLTRELLEELPGIFNWCYEGYLDLMKSGAFEELSDNAEVVNDLMTQMSPTILFLREVFPLQAGNTLDERQLYGLYKIWCDEGGFKKLNRIEFMKDIGLLMRQTRSDVKVRTYEGKRYFVFPGDPKDEDNAETRSEARARTQEAIRLPANSGMEEGSPNDTQAEGESTTTERNASSVTSEGAQAAGDTVSVRPVEAVRPDTRQGSNHSVREPENGKDASDEVRADRAQETPAKSGQVQITEAELEQLALSMEPTFDTPQELASAYMLAKIPFDKMTLRDWWDLRQYYKTNKTVRSAFSTVGIKDFPGEWRENVVRILWEREHDE